MSASGFVYGDRARWLIAQFPAPLGGVGPRPKCGVEAGRPLQGREELRDP
ncbi:hypothetical protein ACFYXC_02270 [Streptomyces sp. NPDC002701]